LAKPEFVLVILSHIQRLLNVMEYQTTAWSKSSVRVKTFIFLCFDGPTHPHLHLYFFFGLP